MKRGVLSLTLIVSSIVIIIVLDDVIDIISPSFDPTALLFLVPPLSVGRRWKI
jgi:hypothetical protein